MLWNRNDSGSGSSYGKVLAPVPVPDPDLFSTVFQQQKICTKSCLLKLEAAMFSRKLAYNFYIFTFVLHFLLDPCPNTVPEPEPVCITVPVPLKQKVAVPVPAPVPQHW